MVIRVTGRRILKKFFRFLMKIQTDFKCSPVGVAGGLLTAGGAVPGRHPQVCRTGVEYYREILWWGSNSDGSIVIHLSEQFVIKSEYFFLDQIM